MQVMQINASQWCTWQTKTTTKNNNRETKTHPNLPDVWAKISFGQDFILDWLNGKCCLVSYPVSIQTKQPFNALNLCSYALCTTLPDHHDTQSIVQTTHLCLKRKDKVMAYLMPIFQVFAFCKLVILEITECNVV